MLKGSLSMTRVMLRKQWSTSDLEAMGYQVTMRRGRRPAKQLCLWRDDKRHWAFTSEALPGWALAGPVDLAEMFAELDWRDGVVPGRGYDHGARLFRFEELLWFGFACDGALPAALPSAWLPAMGTGRVTLASEVNVDEVIPRNFPLSEALYQQGRMYK